MYKLFNPSSAPLKVDKGDDDLLHIIDDLIKENAILRQQRDEFSAKVLFLEDRGHKAEEDDSEEPTVCSSCAGMREELFLAQLELQQRSSGSLSASLTQFQKNVKTASTLKSTADTTECSQQSDCEDISDAVEDRVNLYEAVCANMEEYKGQVRILSNCVNTLESNNARKCIKCICYLHVLIINLRSSSIELRVALEGLRGTSDVPKLKTIIQEKESFIHLLKSERNHYRNRANSLSREMLNESVISERTRCVIANLRADNAKYKEIIEVVKVLSYF